MTIETIECGPIYVNTYVISNTESSECVLIDPGDFDAIESYLNKHALKCRNVLLTHGHFDHILGLHELQQKYDPMIYIHESDKNMLFDQEASLASVFGLDCQTICSCNSFSADRIIQTCCGPFTTIFSPGHSPGSCCYVFDTESAVFTGDTIFYHGYGRTDFPGSDYNQIVQSIERILNIVPGDYLALPGHGCSGLLKNMHPLG